MVIALNEAEKMDEDEKHEVEEATAKSYTVPSILDTFTQLQDGRNNFMLDGGAKLLDFLAHEADDTNLLYTLKRIIRSLGANQLSMRTGYFSTLVVLLSKFHSVTVSQLLKLVKQELTAGSSKSEVGDVSVGHILVCGAVLRSGLALRASEQERNDTLALLFSASRTKSYLKSAAYLMLLDFVQTLDEEQFRSLVWPNVKAELKKPVQEQSLDSLYFLMMVHEKFPQTLKVRKLLGVEEIVCEDTIHAICEKLMNVTDLNQTNHPMYPYISALIAKSEHLKLFWTSGIDSHLTKHNRNRELVAINTLTTILNNISGNYDVIPDLLSKNFFKLFLDWFKGLQTASKFRNKKEDEDDNKMMLKKGRELLNALANVLKSQDVPVTVKIEVLKKLLLDPGDMNVSEITSTPIIKNIIASLNTSGVKKAAKMFTDVLLNTTKMLGKDGTERPWFNYERLKASEYLSHLVMHPAVSGKSSFRLTNMKILMCFAFFKIGGNENVAVSSDLSGAIKTSFYRCLNARLPTAESLVEVLRSLCGFIDENLADEKIRKKLDKQFPEENMHCWITLKKTCDIIEQSSDKTKVDNVFLILLYQLGLFLFSDPKYVEVAKESVKELSSCYEHYKKDSREKEMLKEGDLSEEEPEWIEVLVEVLLSILSCESSVLRGCVQCVFRLLWECLTPSTIGQIVSVLDPDSDSNPLLQDSDTDSDSDSDEENSTKSEKDSSDEKQKEQDNRDEESDSNDEESDKEIEEEDDDENMKIPDQLRMAVQKALGSAAQDSDAESIDADMIDEEEGKKLDKALSEAFKLLRQGKNMKTKKDRKDKKALTDFRVRVLDLVDIYLEKEPAMDICLGMLAPVMRCLEFCIQDNDQRQLEIRVRKTLKHLKSIKKFSSTDGVDKELLADYLKATIEKGSRSQFVFQGLGDMVTEIGSFIVQCSQRLEGKKTPSKKQCDPLVTIYKDSVVNFFQNRSCLLPIIFFHKILQIDWEGNYALVPVIIENTFSENVRQYRRHEGLELLCGFYKVLRGLKPQNIAIKLKPIELQLEKTINASFHESNENFVVKDIFYKLLNKLLTHMEMFYQFIKEPCPIDLKGLSELVSASKPGMKQKLANKETADKQKQNTNKIESPSSGQKKKKQHSSEDLNLESVQKNQNGKVTKERVKKPKKQNTVHNSGGSNFGSEQMKTKKKFNKEIETSASGQKKKNKRHISEDSNLESEEKQVKQNNKVTNERGKKVKNKKKYTINNSGDSTFGSEQMKMKKKRHNSGASVVGPEKKKIKQIV